MPERATLAVARTDVRAALQAHSDAADARFSALWLAHDLPAGMSLMAIGGYGRRELFPYSDLDILLLLPDDSLAAAKDAPNSGSAPAAPAQIAAFIAACWDAGLSLASSVRTVSQCIEDARDIATLTAWLEARCICGAAALAQLWQRRLRAACLCSPAQQEHFYRAKLAEMHQRHLKLAATPYALEPNCKEAPGGLRDLHTVAWIVRALGWAPPQGSVWPLLLARGLATAHEADQLAQHENTLCSVRHALHSVAKRREDRLLFDFQPAVADAVLPLDPQDPSSEPDGADDAAPTTPASRHARSRAERLMRRYYWAAKGITQLVEILLLNLQEHLNVLWHGQRTPALPLQDFAAASDYAGRFCDRGGLIELCASDLFEREPLAILETFLLYTQWPQVQGLAPTTLRALYHARKQMNLAWREHPHNRRVFLAILQQHSGITHVFRLMNQTSVLGRYLWPFRATVGQMQHDLFHVYTVDQHILMVLRNMRRFFIAEHAHEYPHCAEIALHWDQPWLLYVAALFHDIAKGRGGDHSELGAREAEVFCRAHGVGDTERELIVFWVREHLSLSRVAQKEDVYDPAVVARFAQRMPSIRHVQGLYLLTVADIRGTSPKVWNAWKGKLLLDLYSMTLHLLQQASPPAGLQPGAAMLALPNAWALDAQARCAAVQREALALLALRAEPIEAAQRWWPQLDASYFMRHSADDIAWHTRTLWHQVNAPGNPTPSVRVAVRMSPLGEGLQVMVYSADKPDLFAQTCAVFDQAGYSIVEARIYTTPRGMAIDTFEVLSPQDPQHVREYLPLLQHHMQQALQQARALPSPRKGSVSRRGRSFPLTPRVSLAPDEKMQRWLLSVSASDRPGLLYHIAWLLAQYRITLCLAKISTLGERVEDVFLIEGARLHDSHQQMQLEVDLLQALQIPAEPH